jgi:hypothetical protein
MIEAKHYRYFLTVLTAVTIAFGVNSCGLSDRKIADEIIKKVEKYRQQNGRLPDNLKELGMEETIEGPVFYEKKDNNRYIVWYGTTLGESMTYDSKDGRWHDY